MRHPFMTAAALLALACTGAGQTREQAFDSAKAWDHVRAQVAIGPRVAGTPANASARKHIIDTLAGFGVKAVEQPFTSSTPQGPVAMANVIATLPGKSADRILLASHFDTKLFRDARFVGANDGASSTAALLEIGRVLASRPSRPFTIELVFFDGEEAFVEWGPTDGTYGSRHYVDAARGANTLESIRALVLLDMIGDRSLALKREGNSTRWLTDLIWATAQRLGHQAHFLPESTIIEDDHLPFLRAGVPAVDLIDLEYAAWHTPADTIDQISARSLQVVGDVILAALPEIEARLSR